MREQPLEGLRDSERLEAVGAGVAFVSDPPLAVDDVKPIGPASVSDFSRIADFVDEGRKLDAQFHHAHSGQIHALFVASRACNLDFLLLIILVSPKIRGMRLLNVNDEELRFVAISLVQSVERGNLTAERRSGVAPENQHDRPLPAKRRKPYM